MNGNVKGREEKVFQIVISVFLILFMLLALLPFVMLVMSSFSTESLLYLEGYGFWCKQSSKIQKFSPESAEFFGVNYLL